MEASVTLHVCLLLQLTVDVGIADTSSLQPGDITAQQQHTLQTRDSVRSITAVHSKSAT